MALRNNPYLPLYVQDFMTDEKLAECSAEATGVYIRIMCLMHKSDTYGTILLKQKDKQNDNQILNFACKLAKHLPYPESVIHRSLEELIEERVLIIEDDFLVQRRMVKDGIISLKRSTSGKKGGNPSLTGITRGTSSNKFAYAKSQANSDIEIDIESDITLDKKRVKGKKTVNSIPFSIVWDLYEKKVGDKSKLERKWDSLSNEDREKIIAYIPRYIEAEPNKKYRKNFETFLNNHSWEDELISDNGRRNQSSSTSGHKEVQRTTESAKTFTDTL